MGLLSHLASGFGVAFSAQGLSYVLVGALIGSLIGVLPGIGPVAAIALLLPAIHALDVTPALIMLAGVYYGAQYGGSTGAILVIDAHAEAGATVTAIDGHQMARQGRAGPALAAAGLGSFFAGCVGTAVIAALAPLLAELASQFGPAEYFSLMVLGLIGAVVLASGSLIKAIAMIVVGLLLAQVNTDIISGTPRFGFDLPELRDGIGFIVVAMGIFALGEIVAQLEHSPEPRRLVKQELKGLVPTRQDLRDAWPAVVRGTALGSLLGLLPGGGAQLSSFTSYAVEKRLAGVAGKVGKGDIRGVAGPESANNAGAQTSFIPMMGLGIPTNAVMALLVGAMTLKGIIPGPQVMADNPKLFWGVIASMWVGNVMLVVLNLPLVGLFARLLRVPYRYVFPALVLFCCLGVYSLKGSSFDLYLTALFAVVGYLLHKLSCEAAPLLLGFVLGPMMEENLRRALLLSRGDWSAFITRPLSAGLLSAAALMVVVVLLPAISKKRETTFLED
jgi:putative tricarboxylic transport membrane protein